MNERCLCALICNVKLILDLQTFGHFGHANSSFLSLKTLSDTSRSFASFSAFFSSLSGFFQLNILVSDLLTGSFGQVCHHMSSRERNVRRSPV